MNQSQHGTTKQTWKTMGLGGILILLTVLAYLPALRNGFIWDDDAYVTENSTLRNLTGLKEIWLKPSATPQYYPLVHTTFWLEYHLWRLNPIGYHAVNILLHALAAVLLWRVLRKLQLPGAWLATAIWALHPVNVESVAWITERKNVLSAVFYFAAALCYLRFAQKAEGRMQNEELNQSKSGNGWYAPSFPSSIFHFPSSHCYWFSLALFLCALLSKTVACSLPAALLLIAWWKQGGEKKPVGGASVLAGRSGGVGKAGAGFWKRCLSLFVRWGPRVGAPNAMDAEGGSRGRSPHRISLGKHFCLLLPFFAIGIALGLTTAWLEKHHVGASGPEWALSFSQRCLIAGRALWFYAGKLVWPASLSFIYPRWDIRAAVWWQWIFPAAALAVVTALWFARNKIGRGPLVAVLFFAGTLFPALGFVNTYPMRFSFVADHFQYLAGVGLFVLIAAALSRAKWNSGVLLLPVLAALTWHRTHVYYDQETLWRDTLAKNPASYIVNNNLGEAERRQGKLKEALALFRESIRINPENSEAWNNLGLVLGNQGLVSEASESYRHALRTNPNDFDALANLASVLAGEKNYAEALPLFEKALRLKPWDVAIHISYGDALMEVGRQEEAAVQFETALRYDPANARAHEDLIKLQVSQGKTAEAMEHYREVLRQSPHDAVAHYSLGLLLAASGRSAEAEEEYREALRDQPDHAEAHMELGNLLMQEGDKTNAMTHWREAIRVKPYLPPALNSLAWVLATDKDSGLRDGAEAVRLGERAALATGNKSPGVLDTLAAAYAEAGRFNDAVATARKALALASASGSQKIAREIQSHLEAYKAGHPWRE